MPGPPRKAALAAAAIALLAALAPPSLGACGGPTEREDVSYDDRYDETKLDLYLPEGLSAADAPRPAVMLLHPGGWRFGGRYLMAPTARRLANSGYVVANVAYRLVPKVTFPGPVQDAWCALAHLRAHASEYRIDPDRIAVLGYSAGGHAAAMLGVAASDASLVPDCDAAAGALPRPPRAIVAGAPVLDMRAYGDTKLVVDYMGGTAAALPDAYDVASPIRFVRPGLPPFLFVVGGGDDWVGADDSHTMRERLRAAGDDAKLLELEGGGHVLNPVASGEYAWMSAAESPEAWLAIADFLARTVGAP